MSRVVHVLRAGKLPYQRALKLQQTIATQLLQQAKHQTPSPYSNVLILTEHDPVYTIGIRTQGYDAKEESRLRALGADFVRTNRGGLITFHGPGQLVAYPILDLKHFQPSVRWYVCHLERTIIELCGRYGLRAQSTADTGVWIENRKICAMGIHASRYITTHGLALNCNIDLSWFRHIVPCGLVGKSVTSLAGELNQPELGVVGVTEAFLDCFRQSFECDLVPLDVERRMELMGVI
ncbi:putative lipoyltransferase 2, mitochondrial [Anopheles maculipalpis]|uniref:putative lipoyltransferase 2, mitochondrial n=1 Tax=Anopheles maculipalpis TaxID=1496333 RepID=UPI0021594DF1|nr:putative lipoyltransferase 2, mitochondrial [Anopheles maculipalpis]